MFIVHVHVYVKPDCIAAFREASLENARHSLQEEGIARFDVLQEQDEPTNFLLVEVYRAPEDAAWHKETAHYARWREGVADMMATPRHSVKYQNDFPPDEGW
jgi:quinol monooxygenase YgiN